MNSISAFLISLLCMVQANGCVTGNIGEPPNQKMVYELPAPWRIDTEDSMAFIGGDPENPSSIPDAKIDVGVYKKGTDADAKRIAMKSYDNNGTKEFGPQKYTERTIAGRKVYLYQGTSWRPFAILYFEKEGRVMCIILNGSLDQHEKAIERLITTLHFQPVTLN